MKIFTIFLTGFLLAILTAIITIHNVFGIQDSRSTQGEIISRDTTFLRHLNEHCKHLLESNQPDSARIYIDEALHLAEVLNDIEGESYAISNLANYYMDRGLPDLVVGLLDDTIVKYQNTGKEIQLGNLLANAHNMLGNYTKGLEIYLLMRDLAEEKGERRMVIGITQNIGNNYNSLGDIPAAIHAYLTSLEMAEEINDTLIVAVILDNLGSINVNEGNYEIGEEYLHRSLEMNLQIGNLGNQITNHMSLGGLYKNSGRYIEALENYERVLELSAMLGHTLSRVQALYNLGMLNSEMKNFDEAMKLFEESLNLSREYNIPVGSYFNQKGMAEVYSNRGELARAIELYEAALRIAELVQATEMIRSTLQSLHENYAAYGDSANAYHFLKRYTELTDSLSQTARVEALARQESLLGLRSERERSGLLQETIHTQRINTTIILILLSVIIIALGTTILLYHKKRKTNLLLREQSEELRNANDMKDKLLSVLAHDLRTPISNIKGVLYMIREKLLDKKDIEQSLGQIEFQLEQDINTLTNYLQWAQTQRDGIKARMELKSIPELLEKEVIKIKQSAENKSICLKTITDNDMHAPVDAQMFSVIMRNLLNNALKYVNEGSQIIVRAFQTDEKVFVSIEDMGEGIPYHLQPDLFKPFAKVYSTAGVGEIGSGLGLSICKEFAQEMGGDLTFESKPEVGTTFTLTLNKRIETETI